ncbi:hypothetical protein WMY93_007421 [Mugilogobius chulae]|uniref:Uncharacterized protein n=1 Tax=Mugilogobius chulae TaxID=88201 RepID=A0AAW0PD46_9GOBI
MIFFLISDVPASSSSNALFPPAMLPILPLLPPSLLPPATWDQFPSCAKSINSPSDKPSLLLDILIQSQSSLCLTTRELQFENSRVVLPEFLASSNPRSNPCPVFKAAAPGVFFAADVTCFCRTAPL